MEDKDFLSFLPPLIRRHLVPLSLAVVGVILIVFSLWSLVFSSKGQGNEVVFEQGSEHEASIAAVTTEAKIAVDIAGAVVKPGVYSLSPDSRVQEAVAAAGGFSDKANTEWIAKNFNLAAKLSDAAKLYIPFAGEEGNLNTTLSSGNLGSTQPGNKGLININTASEQQLDSLPGVGPVTAQKIISARPYGSVDELLSKKAVGQSVFTKIKDQISIN